MAEAFPGGLTAPLDWINGVLPKAPNLTPDLVKHTILAKMREFFELSQCWRDWVGPITLHAGAPYYSVELSDYKAELVSVLGGYRMSNEYPLRPVANKFIATDAMIYEEGDPQYFFRTPEGIVAIFPTIPEGFEEKVKLFVTMKPIDLCVPQWIRERHYEGILTGVLGDIYLSPGPNYKPDVGARMERRFKAYIGKATDDALVSGTGMSQRVLPPRMVRGTQRFGAGRRLFT